MRELPPTAGLPLRLTDLGPGRAPFAQRVADWLGVDQLQLECSGTAAMVVALRAMHRLRPQRDEVIVPAWTCPLVALAIHRAGLKLRLCDLAPDHFDMDFVELCTHAGPRTLAIVPTHLAGRVADVNAALDVAHRVGAYVLEDAAQALGAKQGGHTVGLLGDAGFFSLAVGKGLTLFEGGLLLTRDPVLRDAFAVSHEATTRPDAKMDWQRALELIGYTLAYRPSLLPLAYGRPLRKALAQNDPVAAVGDDFGPDIPLHTVSAWRQAVGARALPRLPAFLKATRAQAKRRVERLRRIHGVTVFDDQPGQQGVWPFLLLTLPTEAQRDAALKTLWTAGLGVSRLFIHALPDYGYLREIVADTSLPNARSFAARSLTITNSPWLDDATFESICTVLEGATR
ncbi:dTDP-4-amino-4,6-dideoxygalactose transaminase [Dyella jiangningensis]|uniref:DegT/DnrJ/EryC1/StrS family aminotransferase n=1 Tax=Dyella sp. AtDHG13 TaxID=1938897 RepID=UPI000882C460|nr:DegT/DnrJ/EryC1/StrS family aminotransferase [Dyella sp. AtDHG13]PXV58632.1 dTDP-4-amino-4,6-dideoxygalactose transaminase [Dyella sp. AtDHG13]SDL12495.1 dTDP-4-amino-4,6-dideoxygalactose transaminase [Dyella jiangningensis]